MDLHPVDILVRCEGNLYFLWVLNRNGRRLNFSIFLCNSLNKTLCPQHPYYAKFSNRVLKRCEKGLTVVFSRRI